MTAAAHSANDIIEGAFTVVASRDMPIETRSFKNSPNRRRLAARIVLWNFALAFVVVGLPLVF